MCVYDFDGMMIKEFDMFGVICRIFCQFFQVDVDFDILVCDIIILVI